MAVGLHYLRHQLPVLGALGRSAAQAAMQSFGGKRGRKARGDGAPGRAPGPSGAEATLPLPGPELTTTVPPRDPALLRAFVQHLGGDPASYRGVVPPHFFPQWTFPVLTRTLEGIPYPLLALLNGGCRMQVNAPIPLGVPLVTRAQLVGIDDDGRRAILHQRVTTGTTAAPEALVIDFHPIVKLGGKRDERGGDGKAKEKPTVPVDGVREIGRYALPARAGLDFALLTGDFNPVHGVPPAARAMGMKHVILHGFAELGRAIEALVKVLWAGDATRLGGVDVRFVRPLVLPKRVGVYVRENELYVGDAPGGPAYMTGTFWVAGAEPGPNGDKKGA
ncbi:MAG: MaoC/PaaZ C-terminal domain-containing protein [Myxococcota bacterium]